MTAIATRYLDHYRLIRRIDTGAMLDTYEAELLGWDDYTRRLALKTLSPRFEREPAVWQRFVEGATRASSLRHPDMVGVHEVGFDGGAHYLAADLVEGQSLRELIDRCRELGRRFPISAAAYVVRELATTLHDIHVGQPGTGHGDVSPHNVYIVVEGGVKLGDFGASAAALSLLRSDPAAVKDRLPYYAPELLAGVGPNPKTDVFALGLILFELLTGCPFNGGDSAQDMLRHAANPPQLLPSHVVDGVSALDHIVRGALQRDPAVRTPSAEHLGAQLSEYLDLDLFNRVSMVGLVHTLLRAPEQSGARRRSGISGAKGPTPGAPSGRTPSGQTPSGQTPSLLTRDVTHTHAPGVSSPQLPVISEHLVSPGAQAAAPEPQLVVVDAYTRASQAESEEMLELDPEDLVSEQIFKPGWGLVRGLMWFVVAMFLVAGVLAGLLVWRDGSIHRKVDSEPTVASAASAASAEKPFPATSQIPTAASLGVQLTPSDSPSDVASSLPAPVVEVQVADEDDHGQASRSATAKADSEDRGESFPIPAEAASPPKRMALEKAMQIKEISQLTRQANRRGLFAGDDPEFDRWRSEARSAVARGDDGTVQRLRQLVEDFIIDRSFVERKLRRLSSAMARGGLGPKRTASAKGAWLDIQYLVNQGRLVEASREISRALARLRRY